MAYIELAKAMEWSDVRAKADDGPPSIDDMLGAFQPRFLV